MTKAIIDSCLQKIITSSNLHKVILVNGRKICRENEFTRPLPTLISNSHAQVCAYDSNEKRYSIDLVFFNSSLSHKGLRLKSPHLPVVHSALEAKHYSSHQSASLDSYLRYSLSGPIIDLFKLLDCGFAQIFILQIQTEITALMPNPSYSYKDLVDKFPFVKSYVQDKKGNIIGNIARVSREDRINKLIEFSRNILDPHLLYRCNSGRVNVTEGYADVNIHTLINGPFDRIQVMKSLTGFDLSSPLLKQAKNQMPTLLKSSNIGSIQAEQVASMINA